MRSAPLYPDPSPAAVLQAQPRDCSSTCTACSLFQSAPQVCLGAEGSPGGIYVLSEDPGKVGLGKGRHLAGSSGRLIRKTISAAYSGPVVYDAAVRCGAGAKPPAGAVAACRPHVAAVLRGARPERILAIGAGAVEALFGRRPQMDSVRGGYAYLGDIPVFFLPAPWQWEHNHFKRGWFTSDLTLAVRAPHPPKPDLSGAYHTVETPEDAMLACAEIAATNVYTYDVEARGLLYNKDYRILCLTIRGGGPAARIFCWDSKALARPEILEPLCTLLRRKDLGANAQNGKYDSNAVWCAWRVDTPAQIADTRLFCRLLNADALSNLALQANLVGYGGHKDETAGYISAAVARFRAAPDSPQLELFRQALSPARVRLRAHFPKAYAYAEIPEDILLRYCARDTLTTHLLAIHHGRRMLSPVNVTIGHVWGRVMREGYWALTRVERWGVWVDPHALALFREYTTTRYNAARQRLVARGLENPGSPHQISALLFGQLGLVTKRTTESGSPSTDKQALTEMKDQHPIVAELLAYRRVEKMHGSFSMSLGKFIRDDGRIHPNYNLDGARTGRLSASDPGVHQISRPTSEEGKLCRDLFAAPPGKTLIQLDFSQIELRVAADISGDPEMIAIFKSGADYHMRTAELIAPVLGHEWAKLDKLGRKKLRTYSKIVNFSLVYGKGDETLADDMGITVKEATKIREAILGKLKVFSAWYDNTVSEVRRTGEIWTQWQGQKFRKRPLPDIAEPITKLSGTARRGGPNTVVQGSASDYCLASIGAIVRWIWDDLIPAKLVLTVHDSVILEVDDDYVDEVAVKCKSIMESWPTTTGVPLVADVEVGPAWGSLRKWEGENA